MSRLVNIRSKGSDKSIKRTFRIYESGLISEEKSLLTPLSSTMFTRELTHLIMILSGVYKMPNMVAGRRGRRSMIVNQATVYAANIDIILTFIFHSKVLRRRRVPIKRAYMVSALYYPKKVQAIDSAVDEFLKAEFSRERDIEVLAGCFGNIFAEVFDMREDKYSEDIRNFGYYFGKFSYYLNAYNRLGYDEKRALHNPLLYLKKEEPDMYKQFIRAAMKSQTKACLDSINRLPVRDRNEKLIDQISTYFTGVLSRI